MKPLTAEELWEGMVRHYGDYLPDPDHSPIQFKFLVKMFLYQKHLEHIQQNQQNNA